MRKTTFLVALAFVAVSCEDDTITNVCLGIGDGELSLKRFDWVACSPPIEEDSTVIYNSNIMAEFDWSNPPVYYLPQLKTTPCFYYLWP